MQGGVILRFILSLPLWIDRVKFEEAYNDHNRGITWFGTWNASDAALAQLPLGPPTLWRSSDHNLESARRRIHDAVGSDASWVFSIPQSGHRPQELPLIEYLNKRFDLGVTQALSQPVADLDGNTRTTVHLAAYISEGRSGYGVYWGVDDTRQAR